MILNNDTVNDRNWKEDYFFADKKTLGDGVDYLLDHWNNTGNGIESHLFYFVNTLVTHLNFKSSDCHVIVSRSIVTYFYILFFLLFFLNAVIASVVYERIYG